MDKELNQANKKKFFCKKIKYNNLKINHLINRKQTEIISINTPFFWEIFIFELKKKKIFYKHFTLRIF